MNGARTQQRLNSLILRSAVVCSAFVLSSIHAARADDVLALSQSKPTVEVVLCDTGMAREPSGADQAKCPDGQNIRRTLRIPVSVNKTGYAKGPDGRNYESWGVWMSLLVTDSGLRSLRQMPGMNRSDIHTDTVLLQAGWVGLYEFKLNQTITLLATAPWESEGGRKIEYVWDRAGDPNFDLFEARESSDGPNGEPRLLPRLLVPKSGEHIFFQCTGPVLHRGTPTDPLCAVRDFSDRSDDSLSYSLKFSRLDDWRRYSGGSGASSTRSQSSRSGDDDACGIS